jgi:hypothetical protein
MRAKCRSCAIELSFEAKNETISYYCSIPCYHGGQDKAAGKAVILMAPSLAEAIYQVQICQARYDGACRRYDGALVIDSEWCELDKAIKSLKEVALSTALP